MSPPKRPSLLWLRRTITVFVLSIIIIFPAVAVFPASASTSDVKSEPQVVEVSLEECRSLALEHNASVLLAENAVHDARLALEQTEATSLTKPSPTSLYQSRMSLESAGKKPGDN
jgi:outer membrane protein TolC